MRGTARSEPTGNRWSLVVCAGLAVLMAQLDATIVNVALPTIRGDLGASPAGVEWVVLAYLVPLMGLSLLCGRWLGEAGRRAVVTWAAIGFAVSSGAAAVCPGLATLVAARAFQGAFGSALLALAPVLAVESVRPAARGRALGTVATLAPVGAMVGPVLGGQLVNTAGWRSVFLVTIPVAVAVTVLGRRGLVDDKRPLTTPSRTWFGEAALVGAAAALLLAGMSLASKGNLPWLALIPASAAPLVWWWRTDVAAQVRSSFTTRGTPAPHAALLTSYTAVLAVQFLVPFYMHRVLHSDAGVIGLTLLAYPAASAAMGPISGAWTDRSGGRPAAVTGGLMMLAGIALLTPLSAGWTPSDVAWRLAVTGIGFGLCATALQTLAMENAGERRAAATSATTNLARQAGLAFGPALATLAWGLGGYASGGMRAGVTLAAVVAVATAVTATFAKPLHHQYVHHPAIAAGTTKEHMSCP